jgi:UDP-N-acetylglucosamine--N-acetylmuramyl-(pentapeptide) pyrophosphoryl-undecaprenol N-acetylglucosamine transferase
MIDTRPVLIMAGGTGGHVYPALAVAKALRAQNVDVVWLGTRAGLEARVVPDAGIPMRWLNIVGLRGKGLLSQLLMPLRLLLACYQAARVILMVRPRLVLGMGGFVSGPGALMCKLLSRPLVIHEQNAIAGLTNRILARLANSILEAFPGTFNARFNAYHTGNPVRAEIAEMIEPQQRFASRQGPLNLLVLGGSQGARFLNQLLPDAVHSMPKALRPKIRHQAGIQLLDEAKQNYQRCQIEADVQPFLDDMAAAYSWADLVIARAGAMTVAELAAAGLPSILVPFPHAVDDHQTINAGFLANKGAAILAKQSELTADRLGDWLSELAVDRGRLLTMALQARHVARPEATQLVARECLEVAEGYWT